MTQPSPKETAKSMLEYAECIALDTLQDMTDDECVDMVRQFCMQMMAWDPSTEALADDPVKLGISCTATAKLFCMAFERAYVYTDKKVDAIHALKKALGQ